MATPFVAPLYEPQSTLHDLAGADAQSKEGDPHLRSIATITGCHIHASDGEIGHVEDCLVGERSIGRAGLCTSMSTVRRSKTVRPMTRPSRSTERMKKSS